MPGDLPTYTQPLIDRDFLLKNQTKQLDQTAELFDVFYMSVPE